LKRVVISGEVLSRSWRVGVSIAGNFSTFGRSLTGPQPEGGHRTIAPPEIFTNVCIC